MATQEKPTHTLQVETVAETGKAYLFFFPNADIKCWIPKSTVVSKAICDDGTVMATIHQWILEKHEVI